MALLHEELTGKTLEACFEIVNELGAGFLESVYQAALLIALEQKGLRARSQAPVSVMFRGQPVGEFYADIMDKGILCHRLAQKLAHKDLSMPEVQGRRTSRIVPGGRPLHDYANLYLHARNPMLFLRKDCHTGICVFRIRTTVLYLPGVVIADGNAASDYTAFWPAPDGLARLDRALVLAEYWTDPDIFAYWNKKRVRCAEALVPQRVPPEYILGAYVSCDESLARLSAAVPQLAVTVDAHLFFR